VPTDEGIGLDIHQCISPIEESAQSRHDPPRGIVGLSWFNLPFLKQRQLLSKEQILGREGVARPKAGREKVAEVQQHDGGSAQAVPKSGEENQQRGHDAQDRTLRGTSRCSAPFGADFADHNCRGLYQTPIDA
jgi:hypothetical protein